MALNYTILYPTVDIIGDKQNMPVLPAKSVGQRLALDTDSADITGPCELMLMPDETVYIDLQKVGGPALNTAASANRIVAGMPRFFRLAAGTFRLRAGAA